MATIAEVTLAADEFPLGTVFSQLPDVTVQLERIIPDANGVVPYFWVQGAESDDIVAEFSNHPGVRDIQVVDSFEDEYLMRCEWVADYASVLDALVAPEIVLLSAIGTAEEWTFELRGETREDIAAFQDFCYSHDIPVTLTELHALRPLEAEHDLTDTQREALIVAHQHGYFESPREATLDEVAEQLGISQQALGSRIQRGTRRLIEQGLIETG